MVVKDVFPADWDIDILGNCARIETGGRNTEDKNDDGRYPFFVRSQKVEHINTYHYDCEAILTAGASLAASKMEPAIFFAVRIPFPPASNMACLVAVIELVLPILSF